MLHCRVACCKGYRLCNTYAKLQCCSKSPRRHSYRQRDRQTIEQSCLSVFSQPLPLPLPAAPPPPQLQVVVGGAAKTMRESTFKVNWASRLLGRKWKWKWRILDYSLFVFFSLPLLLLFFFFCCFFVVSVSFERSPNRTNLLAICVVRQGEFTFVCFAAQNHLAQLEFFSPFYPLPLLLPPPHPPLRFA